MSKLIRYYIISAFVFLAVGTAIYVLGATGFFRVPSVDVTLACNSDDDCVTAQCCHPTSVVNKNFAPDCRNIMCTQVCQGPIDCGAGRPACVNKKCTITPLSRA